MPCLISLLHISDNVIAIIPLQVNPQELAQVSVEHTVPVHENDSQLTSSTSTGTFYDMLLKNIMRK